MVPPLVCYGGTYDGDLFLLFLIHLDRFGPINVKLSNLGQLLGVVKYVFCGGSIVNIYVYHNTQLHVHLKASCHMFG